MIHSVDDTLYVLIINLILFFQKYVIKCLVEYFQKDLFTNVAPSSWIL